METITATRLTINDNLDPFIPNKEEGWKVSAGEHKCHTNPIEWDPEKIESVLVSGQENGLRGHEVRKEIFKNDENGAPVYDGANATFLDALLQHFKDHPEEIPASFKPSGDNFYKCHVCWWTIYTDSQEAKKYVRGIMVSREGKCQGSYISLDHEFSSSEPALIFKKI